MSWSSGRMSKLDEKDLWMVLQNWYAEHVCSPIFRDWLESSIVFGAIPLPIAKLEKFNAPNWHGRRWGWVNPVDEIAARVRELNSGQTSLTRSLAEEGTDRDELLDEIQDDLRAIKDRGLILPELYEWAVKTKGGADPQKSDGEEQAGEVVRGISSSQ